MTAGPAKPKRPPAESSEDAYSREWVRMHAELSIELAKIGQIILGSKPPPKPKGERLAEVEAALARIRAALDETD
jgi:hypothetical protein